MYYRRDPRDVASLSADCLIGRNLTSLDSSAAPGSWVFGFGADCRLTVESAWRVVNEGRLTVAGDDHAQTFGLTEPVDSRQRALKEIGASVVAEVGYDDVTGDLRIVFASRVRLEVWTHSVGYESWTLWRPDGTQLVAVGGGEVVAFAPESNR